MSFLVNLAWMIASTVVSALLAPKAENAKASGLGDFTEPTALEGRPLPLVLGTCKLTGPNVMWWGHLSHGRIRRKSGLFSATTIGYKYYLGMQLGLCVGPIDAIEDIYAGDKSLRKEDEKRRLTLSEGAMTAFRDDGTYDSAGAAFPWLAQGGHKEVEIYDLAELFGGEEREGGIGGRIHAYFGAADQPADPYLVEQFGGAAPAYRGLCYLRLGGPKKGFYVGTQKTVKDWAPVVRHCPVPCGLSSAKGNIGGSANIAYACAWLLTLASDYGGFGVSTSRLDLPTFQAAADRLYAEGLGISLVMDTQKSRDAWLSELLRIADGVLYTDPQTGLWTLKLIRADYDPATLPELTVDDTLEAPAVTRPSWGDTINQVLVRYTDRSQDYTTRTVQARDAANIRARGGEVASETVDYLAVDNAAAANRLVARDLQTRAYPLAQIQGLKANRKAWAWRPGQPFKLTWPAQGYSGMVCRVTKIRYGTLENPEITLDAVEDIFGLEVAQYAPPPASGWVDPAAAPVALEAQGLVEAPHWMVGETRQVLALGTPGDGTSTAAQVWTNEGAGYLRTAQLDPLTPSGTLAAACAARTAGLDAAGFTVSGDLADLVAESTNADGRAAGANLALVGAEWMSWTTCTPNADGTFTFSGVLRGVMDTVPVDHAAGERVWFVTEGAVPLRPTPYAADLTCRAKLLPVNELGTLALASAAELQLTTTSRAWRPLPPGYVRLNGSTYASWPTTTTGDVTLSWAWRARTTQASGAPLVSQDDPASASPEGTLQVEALVGGVVRRTWTGLTATSLTYTLAQRQADDADAAKAVAFRITPVNGSLTGTVRLTPGFVMG